MFDENFSFSVDLDASHIHFNNFNSLSLHSSFSDHPKNQLRIELFSSPRSHSFAIEVCGDLAAIHTVLFQPQNAVYEGLMGRVNVYPRQCFGLDGNPETEVIFR
jgi:hypothetical protein